MDSHFFQMGLMPAARQPEVRVGAVKVIAQMTEGFLNRCAQAWLVAHRGQLQWSDSTRTTRFEVTRLEAGLVQGKPRQVKFFGKLKGELFFSGRKVAAALGDWEAILTLAFEQGQLQLEVLPESLKVQITDPLRLPVPPGWAAGLETLLASKFGRGVTLPVPLIYAEQLTRCGLRATEPLGVWTHATGDRRAGLLVVAGPPREGEGGPDVMERRMALHDFSVSLSSEAVNAALEQHLDRILPAHYPVPPELTGLASEVVLLRLIMRYEGQRFRIPEAEVLLRGAVPGGELEARLMGYADLQTGRGGCLKLQPSIESVVFLSKTLHQLGAEVQEMLRQQTRAALSSLELDFLLPNKLLVRELAKSLDLVEVQTGPDELRFLGRMMG